MRPSGKAANALLPLKAVNAPLQENSTRESI